MWPCLIPQLAQWKCRCWKKFTLQVWMCDAAQSIFSESGGWVGGIQGSQILSAQVTQRLWGLSRHGGRGFPSLMLCLSSAETPAPTWPEQPVAWHGHCLTSEGETGKRGVPLKLLGWSLASASILEQRRISSTKQIHLFCARQAKILSLNK